MNKMYAFIVAALCAAFPATTTLAAIPFQEELAGVVVEFTEPDSVPSALKKEIVTAPASAYAVLNNQRGNALVGIDGYYSVLLGLFTAAQGDTLTRLDEATATPTRRNIPVQTRELNACDGYTNAVIAITPASFNRNWAEVYGDRFGAKLLE